MVPSRVVDAKRAALSRCSHVCLRSTMFRPMCGIAGSTADPNGQGVHVMSAMLRHRGPDDDGLHTDRRTGVTIGVPRLAIMDVAGGHQPLANEDGSGWVL